MHRLLLLQAFAKHSQASAAANLHPFRAWPLKPLSESRDGCIVCCCFRHLPSTSRRQLQQICIHSRAWRKIAFVRPGQDASFAAASGICQAQSRRQLQQICIHSGPGVKSHLSDRDGCIVCCCFRSFAKHSPGVSSSKSGIHSGPGVETHLSDKDRMHRLLLLQAFVKHSPCVSCSKSRIHSGPGVETHLSDRDRMHRLLLLQAFAKHIQASAAANLHPFRAWRKIAFVRPGQDASFAAASGICQAQPGVSSSKFASIQGLALKRICQTRTGCIVCCCFRHLSSTVRASAAANLHPFRAWR